MIVASQMRAGMAVRYEGQTYKVLAAEYHPGQGKMGGATHARLQNAGTGTIWEHSFRADLKLEDVSAEKQALEYLYDDGAQYVFMNPETFEQTEIEKESVGSLAAFLEAGKRFTVEFVEGRALGVQFPDTMEVEIADTAPAMHQGENSAFKPAKLANGLEIMVPQFIKTGDAVRLDLRTLKYVDRVKNELRARI